MNKAVGSDKTAVTPLQIAVRNGHAPMVRLLLNSGAKDDGGRALSDAVRNNRSDLVDILLGVSLAKACDVHVIKHSFTVL